MYTRLIGRGSNWLLDKIVGGIAATGLHPNFLTVFGLLANIGAATLFILAGSTSDAGQPAEQARLFRLAAVMVFVAGFFDLADGPVARRMGRVSVFGAFFDSMIDRYSDMVLYMGLVVYYAMIGRFFYVVLAVVAMASSFMVSYSRARAESLIPTCRVGFMERPERLVLLIIGGAFNRMAPVLWVIAVLSTVTVIHRIVHTWRETAAGRTLPNVSLPH